MTPGGPVVPGGPPVVPGTTCPRCSRGPLPKGDHRGDHPEGAIRLGGDGDHSTHTGGLAEVADALGGHAACADHMDRRRRHAPHAASRRVARKRQAQAPGEPRGTKQAAAVDDRPQEKSRDRAAKVVGPSAESAIPVDITLTRAVDQGRQAPHLISSQGVGHA